MLSAVSAEEHDRRHPEVGFDEVILIFEVYSVARVKQVYGQSIIVQIDSLGSGVVNLYVLVVIVSLIVHFSAIGPGEIGTAIIDFLYQEMVNLRLRGLSVLVTVSAAACKYG